VRATNRRAEETPPPNLRAKVVAEQPPVTLAGTFPERITIEPSAGLMKLLWSALAVAVAAVAVAGAGHFV